MAYEAWQAPANKVLAGPLLAGAADGAAAFRSLVPADILTTDPLSPIGYGVGAGGVVVQSSQKTDAITLNTVTGKITFASSALGSQVTSSCTWTNAALTTADVIVFNHVSGGTLGGYRIDAQCSAGTAVLYIRNISTASLTEAPVVQFCVLNGQQS